MGPACDSTPVPKTGGLCVSSARWHLRGGLTGAAGNSGPYRDRSVLFRGSLGVKLPGRPDYESLPAR